MSRIRPLSTACGGTDRRTRERLRAHYELERGLAERLRTAPVESRRRVYRDVYNELFRSLPDHPQLTRKADPESHASSLAAQVRLLGRYVRTGSTFLELGAGDCRLSNALAHRAAKVLAIDVSEEITRSEGRPENVLVLLTDGVEIPVPRRSVDTAYSNQLMEHLHPDDAREQLANVFEALAPGGAYVCATPNRLSGPHDISEYFDEVATGFHLREYTTGELRQLLLKAGFGDVKALVRLKQVVFELPTAPLIVAERLLGRLPHRARRAILRRTPLGKLFGTVVGRKSIPRDLGRLQARHLP
jgi:SAM-dependent methyltransferase